MKKNLLTVIFRIELQWTSSVWCSGVMSYTVGTIFQCLFDKTHRPCSNCWICLINRSINFYSVFLFIVFYFFCEAYPVSVSGVLLESWQRTGHYWMCAMLLLWAKLHCSLLSPSSSHTHTRFGVFDVFALGFCF